MNAKTEARDRAETRTTGSIPAGDCNYKFNIEVTADGVVLDDAILIDWEWIDRARTQVMSIPDKLAAIQARADAAPRLRHRHVSETSDTIHDELLMPADDIARLLSEVKRLRRLCESVHDRLLRGEEDRELLVMLDEANDPNKSAL